MSRTHATIHRRPPVQRSNLASHWTTRPSHAKLLCEHAESTPERHPRHTPTDRAPPLPRARVITTAPATPQTPPFAAPCLTATARRRRRRLCRRAPHVPDHF